MVWVEDYEEKTERIDKDFLDRAKHITDCYYNKVYQEYLKKHRTLNYKWQKNNQKKFKESQKKYSLTEKGRYAISLSQFNRRTKFKSANQDISWEEKKLIGLFYKNCPIGYEVDHIHPISKGGKHCLSNLQYLTKEDNRKKSAKIG